MPRPPRFRPLAITLGWTPLRAPCRQVWIDFRCQVYLRQGGKQLKTDTVKGGHASDDCRLVVACGLRALSGARLASGGWAGCSDPQKEKVACAKTSSR
eukprot:scaffold37267_cov66-Phaeocystis_antarctica.AAC.4